MSAEIQVERNIRALRARLAWLDKRIAAVNEPARSSYDIQEAQALRWALEILS